jgi:hypothetical protein
MVEYEGRRTRVVPSFLAVIRVSALEFAIRTWLRATGAIPPGLLEENRAKICVPPQGRRADPHFARELLIQEIGGEWTLTQKRICTVRDKENKLR